MSMPHAVSPAAADRLADLVLSNIDLFGAGKPPLHQINIKC